ncbi:hypothetical protein D3C72_2395230 [compost metagenome]
MVSVSSSSSSVGGNWCTASSRVMRSTKSGCRNSSADTFTEIMIGMPLCIHTAASRTACSMTHAPSVTM